MTNSTGCSCGCAQSPIDLADAYSAELGDRGLMVDWDESTQPATVEKGDHGLNVVLKGGSFNIRVNRESYSLAQFHFHQPSEHTVDGVLSDAEVHFVHSRHLSDGSAYHAVIGVLLQRDDSAAPNPQLAPLFEAATEAWQSGSAEVKGGTSPRLFAPEFDPSQGYFRYEGSLTTGGPDSDCYDEVVSWTVLSEPLKISGEDMDTLHNAFRQSAREVQHLNRRYVLEQRASGS